MEFFDKLIEGINNFARDMASSFSTNSTCSKCIKCKQCIKTLSNGKQVRIFTCPAVDDTLYNNEYIDSVLPSVQNINTQYTEYVEAYQKNRDAIYDYLYSTGALYLDTAKPINNEKCYPIFTFNELEYNYQAMECPMFRPFLDNNNIINNNDTLITSTVPDLYNFDELSREDKIIITQRYDW